MLLRVRRGGRRRLVVRVGEPALRLWVERRLLWVYCSCAGRDGRLECAGASVRWRASTYILRIVSLHLLLLLLDVYILNALSWDEPGRQFVLLLLLLGLLWLLLLLLGSLVVVVLIIADMLLVKPCARRGVTADGVVAFARRSNRLPGITAAPRNSQIDRLVG